jgi:hypothetical protein
MTTSQVGEHSTRLWRFSNVTPWAQTQCRFKSCRRTILRTVKRTIYKSFTQSVSATILRDTWMVIPFFEWALNFQRNLLPPTHSQTCPSLPYTVIMTIRLEMAMIFLPLSIFCLSQVLSITSVDNKQLTRWRLHRSSCRREIRKWHCTAWAACETNG